MILTHPETSAFLESGTVQCNSVAFVLIKRVHALRKHVHAWLMHVDAHSMPVEPAQVEVYNVSRRRRVEPSHMLALRCAMAGGCECRVL